VTSENRLDFGGELDQTTLSWESGLGLQLLWRTFAVPECFSTRVLLVHIWCQG